MDASALRPAAKRNNVPFGPAQLVCLSAAVALHLAILWWLHSNPVDPIAPPEPMTMSARWAGESNTDESPARSAAPAVPAQPPVIKKPAPVPQKVVKPVVKKPAPKPVPKAPPRPTPMAKPVTQTQPLVAPAAPSSTASPNSQSASSTSSKSATAKTGQTGTGGGSSAPIARDARLNNPEPPYPQESRRRGEEGRVVLKVRVTKEGTAESVEVEHSSGFRRLDMIARKTVSRWRFIPARQNNVAVADWAGVTIIFKLGS